MTSPSPQPKAAIGLGIAIGAAIGLLSTLFFLWSDAAPARPPGDDTETVGQLKQKVLERISEARSLFLVEQVGLSPEAARQLEPILVARDEQRLAAQLELRAAKDALAELDGLDDAEIEARIQQLAQATRAWDELRYFAFEVKLPFLDLKSRARLALLLPDFERRVEKRIHQARQQGALGKGGMGKAKNREGGMGKNKGKWKKRRSP
ncbi:MAG: hypothetical protein RBU37_16535 [Myxococcota bacterium]|jgi:hypothetical protein|nr:hypothetical protein [Myxococcota bacterium]